MVVKQQAKKRAAAMAAEEEKVSLIGNDGEAAPRPSLRTKRSPKLGLVESVLQAWSLPRIIKYMALCSATAMVTFFMLRREQKAVHWEQYQSLLEPEAKEQRCYVSQRNAMQ
jgi:inner membrane protein involved in colicin E2 resistance